jgi:hypothetical protein
MIYVFENSAGEIVEADFPMGEAPQRVRRKGVTFKRKIIPFQTTATVRPTLRDHHFRAMSQPRWWPFAPRHDTDGTPLYDGIQEVREAEAKAKDAGEVVKYDR